MSDNRARYWTFILYPGEIDVRFVELLRSLNVPCCISPLHDPDRKNISPEEQRKPHHHVLLYFEGKKSEEQIVNMLFGLFGSHCGWTKPFVAASAKGLVRYFIHLDQPEKQQFPNKWESITCLNGFTYDDFFECSSSQRDRYIADMQEWCIKNDIYEIFQLQEEARIGHYDSWHHLLNTNSLYVMKSWLDSRRNMRKTTLGKRVVYRHEK